MPVTNLVIDVQHQLNHQHTDGKIQHVILKFSINTTNAVTFFLYNYSMK